MPIQIFTVGGTIDKEYFDQKSRYEVGNPKIVDILREANVTFRFRIESLMKKDSLEMTAADRELIRQKVQDTNSERIIITHGTDTMVKTAKKLRGMDGKTIVLTGAMSPARFKSSDAAFNIGAAAAAVQVLPPGVYIVANGRIFDPAKIRKNREANRFEEI
ncbi:MAG: asparaginase domain-containing protein [Desulfobacterales bacterium]|jgi:L-asparaginase